MVLVCCSNGWTDGFRLHPRFVLSTWARTVLAPRPTLAPKTIFIFESVQLPRCARKSVFFPYQVRWTPPCHGIFGPYMGMDFDQIQPHQRRSQPQGVPRECEPHVSRDRTLVVDHVPPRPFSTDPRPMGRPRREPSSATAMREGKDKRNPPRSVPITGPGSDRSRIRVHLGVRRGRSLGMYNSRLRVRIAIHVARWRLRWRTSWRRT